MTVILDTNVIVRLMVDDDEEQAAQAAALVDMQTAVVPPIALCEAAWVLRSSYGFRSYDIRDALAALLGYASVKTDRDAAALGFAFLDAGADFADGMIVHQGRVLGGDQFVTFDRRARAAAMTLGLDSRAPGERGRG